MNGEGKRIRMRNCKQPNVFSLFCFPFAIHILGAGVCAHFASPSYLFRNGFNRLQRALEAMSRRECVPQHRARGDRRMEIICGAAIKPGERRVPDSTFAHGASGDDFVWKSFCLRSAHDLYDLSGETTGSAAASMKCSRIGTITLDASASECGPSAGHDSIGYSTTPNRIESFLSCEEMTETVDCNRAISVALVRRPLPTRARARVSSRFFSV